MKAYIPVFIVIFFGCSGSGKQTPATTTTVATEQTSAPRTLNADSLNRIETDIRKHFELVRQLFNTLQLDSLNANDGEAYRMVVSRETSSEDMEIQSLLPFTKKRVNVPLRYTKYLRQKILQ